MTKDEALRLALDTLKEVREETFRLMRNGEKLYAEDKVWSTIISVQEALETKDEFVAWEQFYPDIGKPQIAFNTGKVEYVAPQRTWVGLTEDQIDELEKEFIGFSVPNIYNFVQAIEAKLKEKNT
jgi:hypothetical protein